MFVFLKLLLFLFRPLVWVIIFMIAAAIAKTPRRKTVFFCIGLGLLLFFSNPYIGTALLRAYETKPVVLEKGKVYEAGVVLGGFVAYNLADDKGYFNPSADRFIETALLYKTGIIKRVIVAAGNGYLIEHQFREADFVKEKLLQLGIPDSAVFVDGDSKNTLQNAINTKRICDSLQMRGPLLLISSAMHLPRARRAFAAQGLPVALYPCDYLSKNVSNNFLEDVLLPSATALRNWENFIKEILGFVAYKLTGKGS